MLAPVVPMKLASVAPIATSATLVIGVASMSPKISTPPVVT
jgi:hypothetical protein